MSATSLPATAPTKAQPVSRPRQFVASIGAYVHRVVLLLAQTVGVTIGVLRAGLRPSCWRRTLRTEFHRHLTNVGARAVASALVVGGILGLGLVFQALFWLESVGQGDLVGAILVRGLVRDTAPFLVALIVIGRSGSLMVIELVAMRENGQLRALHASGVDPFELLVVPRVFALTVATFMLTVFFIVSALFAGYLAASFSGTSERDFLDFLNNLLSGMSISDYVLVAVKAPSLGFAIGVIAATTALGRLETDQRADRQLPRNFMRAFLCVLVLSLALDLAI